MPSSRLALAVLLLLASGCDNHQDSTDHRVLVGTEPARSGACPHGGTRVLSGLDLDGNGVLDASEVTVTRDVCADTPSDPGALVRLDAEAPGSRCPRGGTAVRSGLDRNHDGILTVSSRPFSWRVRWRSECDLGSFAAVAVMSAKWALQGSGPRPIEPRS